VNYCSGGWRINGLPVSRLCLIMLVFLFCPAMKAQPTCTSEGYLLADPAEFHGSAGYEHAGEVTCQTYSVPSGRRWIAIQYFVSWDQHPQPASQQRLSLTIKFNGTTLLSEGYETVLSPSYFSSPGAACGIYTCFSKVVYRILAIPGADLLPKTVPAISRN